MMVHAAGRQDRGVLVQDDDVAGLDAGLLQPLGNRHDQRGMGGDSFAAEAVDFEADHLILRAALLMICFHASTGLSWPV